MFEQIAAPLYTASTWVIPLVIAITFHEASHGYVARGAAELTKTELTKTPRQLALYPGSAL